MEIWGQGWNVLFDTLEGLSFQDLEKIIYIRNEGHTVIESINRQLCHYSYHVGQIVMIGKIICGDKWNSLSIPKGESQSFNLNKFSKDTGQDNNLASLKGETEGAVTHDFADGQYIRTIVMPKGLALVSRIHNKNHPFFIMKGECSIYTEKGLERVKAPHNGVTLAGTQRLMFIHEECTFITVHRTDCLTPEEVIKEVSLIKEIKEDKEKREDYTKERTFTIDPDSAKDFDDALKLVNDHEFGNGVSIFTRDGDSGRTFSNKAKIGMVGINIPIPVPMAFHSFGGWKRSLFGDQHMHGPEGVRFYTKLKTITSRWPSGSRSDPEFVMPTMK